MPRRQQQEQRISIPFSELTTRQLVLLLHERLTILMADLNQEVQDLQQAVADIGTRFDASVGSLTTALGEAQSALADMTVDDEAQKQAVADALDNASTQADTIKTQVDALNSIGATQDPNNPPDNPGPTA